MTTSVSLVRQIDYHRARGIIFEIRANHSGWIFQAWRLQEDGPPQEIVDIGPGVLFNDIVQAGLEAIDRQL